MNRVLPTILRVPCRSGLCGTQGNVRLLAQSTNTDAWSFTRQAYPSTAWAPGLDIGGAMRSRPAAVRLSDGTPAAFGLDAGGALWLRRYDAAAVELLPWTKQGGSGVKGELTLVAGVNRKVSIFALAADGTPVFTTSTNGSFAGWSELGGSGFTATPAAVKMPGEILRVFARGADGQIRTQVQSSGGTFPGTWAPVSTLTTAGPPAALLDSPTGRIVVFARGADNEIYRTFETAAGSATWGPWLRLNRDASDLSATDPTVAEFTSGSSQSYLIVFRNANDATRVYTRNDAVINKAAAAEPAFTAHRLPPPPE